MELKELNKHIRAIQNVFIERLKLGKFKVVEQDEYNVIVKMGKYKFKFWIANDIDGFKVFGTSSMQLNMTDAQKRDVWKQFKTRCKL